MIEGLKNRTGGWFGPNVIIWFGIIALLIGPWLFTFPAFLGRLDFSETGQIGDTIGGITAPFINLVAAILVYYSFREQYKANQIQREALDEERKNGKYERQYSFILSLIQNLDERINLFSYRKKVTGREDITKLGAEGIQYFINELHKERKHPQVDGRLVGKLKTMKRDEALSLEFYSGVYQLARVIDFIGNKIRSSSIPEEMKRDCFDRLDITYTSSLESSLQTFDETYPEDNYSNTTINEIKQTQKRYLSLRETILNI